MSEKALDQGKRQFLVTATGVVGGVAAGAAAVPFLARMRFILYYLVPCQN